MINQFHPQNDFLSVKIRLNSLSQFVWDEILLVAYFPIMCENIIYLRQYRSIRKMTQLCAVLAVLVLVVPVVIVISNNTNSTIATRSQLLLSEKRNFKSPFFLIRCHKLSKTLILHYQWQVEIKPLVSHVEIASFRKNKPIVCDMS